MTRDDIRAEADQAAQDFAEEVASLGQETSGIPRPPRIEVTETETDVDPFGLNFEEPESASEAPVTQGPPGGGPPPCDPCASRHLSIKFRCAGNIQSDGCSPNAGLTSWDCGFHGSAYDVPYEVDILPCVSTFSQNFTLGWSNSLCTLWESCGEEVDPSVCNWYAGVKMSLVGGHTLHFEYDTNTYYASVATTRICDGSPVVVAATYDSTVNGLPPLPTDIVVPDWCAAVGTQLFSYNGFWSIDFAAGECDCFGGPKTIILGFGLYFYINVT